MRRRGPGQDARQCEWRGGGGEPWPVTEGQLKVGGHASEGRMYAGHRARGFLASTGALRHLRRPEGVECAMDETELREPCGTDGKRLDYVGVAGKVGLIGGR
ncbi:hypothetical protein A6V37_38035 [Paraburkholderia ginsengiterrae]|uniref:Uncharacterized protein n=1 Tax=Paraburkholderia ginsengiterrae TaxID=1462993 RepID=A0A1A9NBA3_9BURK|nr:hypothetical protein A6V37_38035 [Paraburkholderia ginsengiterrae]